MTLAGLKLEYPGRRPLRPIRFGGAREGLIYARYEVRLSSDSVDPLGCRQLKGAIWRMKRIYYLALFATALACSIADKDRCSEGRTWSPQLKGCLDVDGGAGNINDASGGSASAAGGTGVAGDSSVAGTASTDASNLGSTCRADTDCASGVATSCLLNPQAPSSPGMCTIPSCDAAACGDAYDCCDCTAAPALKSTWTVPKCVPTANTATMKALSCNCQ